MTPQQQPKFNIGSIAAILVALGVGGTLGHVATGVVGYTSTMQTVAQAQYDADNDAPVIVLKADIGATTASAQLMDSSAKAAYQDAYKAAKKH